MFHVPGEGLGHAVHYGRQERAVRGAPVPFAHHKKVKGASPSLLLSSIPTVLSLRLPSFAICQDNLGISPWSHVGHWFLLLGASLSQA